ncbi:MAG: peptidoglycan/xylan/chitin deacetylase (PgdA/CDA1 family) [Phenylobacterium sp.]|jgi:peptidoglycan/xylan/chitin deacetylase (PgdA/CDA1 family)
MLSAPALSAVILQYHHVSSETPAITSVSSHTFLTHMNYLKAQGYKVVALPQLIAKIRAKQAIDDKTVVITFDDGYRNVYQNARPILKQFDWPYTVFINPKAIDDKYANHMSWAQIRQITGEKATIANHTMLHDYLVRLPAGLTGKQWLSKVEQDIKLAESRIVAQTGQNHQMLAYPYGEFSLSVQKLLKDNGFIGFGQHSGAVGLTTDLSRIPRFPASGRYAKMDSLAIKIASLAMPVIALKNANPVIAQNPPTLMVTVDNQDFLPRTVQCFIGSGRAQVKWLEPPTNTAKTVNTFTVSASHKLPKERSRYNCTAPSIAKPDRFYWFSQPWINLD